MFKKQKMSTISISVFSADLKLIGFENRRELHLSCGLVNIARGNCNVIMKPDTNNINGEILISSERPVMNADLSVPPILFDQVHSALKNNVDREMKHGLFYLPLSRVWVNQNWSRIKTKRNKLTWVRPICPRALIAASRGEQVLGLSAHLYINAYLLELFVWRN